MQPPPKLQLTGNVAENWRRFKQRFELYLSAIDADGKEDRVKASMFLHVIGDEALEVYNNFVFEEGDKMKLDKILQRFEAYCIPKRNVTYERHRFFTCVQKQGETIDQYVTELRNRSKTCEFGELTDSLIKDRIVCGIPDSALRERLLREQELNLEKALVLCRAAETVKSQVKELVSENCTVDALKKQVRKSSNAQKDKRLTGGTRDPPDSSRKQCHRCGTQHLPRKCPAYGKNCNECGKPNHYARCCKSEKKRSQVHAVNENEVEEFYIDMVSQNVQKQKDWMIPLQVQNETIQFKLDTGAQVNVISESVYNELKPRPKLHDAKVKVTGYAGTDIPVKGKCLARVTYKETVHILLFIVVPKEVQAILGLVACEKLNLVKRVLVIESGLENDYNSMMQEYRDLFKGLGCLPGEHTIRIDKTVPPVIHPCRKVPFALRHELKAELDRMEDLGVIQKIDEPTEWVSSLVIVDKKNGKLRICLDPRDLNKAIKREHFKLPTREEIMAQFANAKYFSKLDASSGFWQLKLDETSSKLCTFNTPFARYRFLRLPFGIASAPEVYHKTIHLVYEHIEGVDTSMDDIIIWGATKEEHDSRLRRVLEATRNANLKLNRDKCLLGVSELTFVGDIVSSKGIRPDPMKVSAIENMPRPQCKKDVQRFMGMINYMGKFIPNLSEKIAPLRWLTEKKNEWDWNQEQEKAWQQLKKVLTEEPVLRFYDPARPMKISSDASKTGLGAVLLQKYEEDWQPVAYASRSMTGAETRYAQIEKELLSITFASERFHQFIAGQTVSVETDHKPLIALFLKPLNDCPLRIQRLMIKLQRYTLNVSYIPGKFMYTADTLSRAVDPKAPAINKTAEEVQAYVNMVTLSLPVADAKMQLIREETEKDQTLKQLKQVVLTGWPQVRQQCVSDIQEYWNCRAELTVVDDMIYKGSKIVIPKSLQKMMLEKVHEGHLGMEKCKRRAREVMFWPRINKEISDLVSLCQTCLKYRPRNPSEPLMPHPVPQRPYQKVGADLFTCNNKDFLIVTDYYSLYPEVCGLSSTSAENVITCMKSIFSRHGIPTEVFTDNGPQFSCASFKTFSDAWDFVHTTSSPHFPQSNGLAEKSVGIVKKLMRKAKDSRSDFYKALLVYRSTPLECGYSPSQLLMGRRIRSNLPVKEELLEIEEGRRVRQHKESERSKQKIYYDMKVRHLPELHEGDGVRLKDKEDTWGKKGTVLEKVQPRSYTIQTEDGAVLRRNRCDILKEPELNRANSGSETLQDTVMPNSDEEKSSIRRSTRTHKPPERLIESC